MSYYAYFTRNVLYLNNDRIFVMIFSFRYYAVMHESFISKKMAIVLGTLGILLMLIHASVFSMVQDNISSLQRTCIAPNAKYDFPADRTYAMSMFSILIYNIISFVLCLIVYMYLLNEEKKATCRNKLNIEVS